MYKNSLNIRIIADNDEIVHLPNPVQNLLRYPHHRCRYVAEFLPLNRQGQHLEGDQFLSTMIKILI